MGDILNISTVIKLFIFLCFLLNTAVCVPAHATDIEKQKKDIQKKINHVRWLENMEQNKLYKNQQKLESAKNTLNESKTQI